LTGCDTRKLRKQQGHTSQGGRQAISSIYQEEVHSSTGRIPAPSAQRRSARDHQPNRFLFLEITLRKMYLVSAEKVFSERPEKNLQLLFLAKKASRRSPHSPPSKKNKKKNKTRKATPLQQMG